MSDFVRTELRRMMLRRIRAKVLEDMRLYEAGVRELKAYREFRKTLVK